MWKPRHSQGRCNKSRYEDDMMAVVGQCTVELESKIDDEEKHIQEKRIVEVVNCATPKRRRRNKAPYIKPEMGKRYTAEELKGHRWGGERIIYGKMVH